MTVASETTRVAADYIGFEWTNANGHRCVVENAEGQCARIRIHLKPAGCGRGKGRVIRRLMMLNELPAR